MKFNIKDILNLEEITKIFFSNRRKMINKSIKNFKSGSIKKNFTIKS